MGTHWRLFFWFNPRRYQRNFGGDPITDQYLDGKLGAVLPEDYQARPLVLIPPSDADRQCSASGLYTATLQCLRCPCESCDECHFLQHIAKIFEESHKPSLTSTFFTAPTIAASRHPPFLINMLLGSSARAYRTMVSEVAGTVGAVVGLMILVYVYWRWGMTPVSRRLLGARKGEPASQRDLPYEIRSRYEAVAVLGCGAFGVVLDAWQLSNGKKTIRRAIKLVHSKDSSLTEKDIRRLNREVACLIRLDAISFGSESLVYW